MKRENIKCDCCQRVTKQSLLFLEFNTAYYENSMLTLSLVDICQNCIKKYPHNSKVQYAVKFKNDYIRHAIEQRKKELVEIDENLPVYIVSIESESFIHYFDKSEFFRGDALRYFETFKHRKKVPIKITYSNKTTENIN